MDFSDIFYSSFYLFPFFHFIRSYMEASCVEECCIKAAVTKEREILLLAIVKETISFETRFCFCFFG